MLKTFTFFRARRTRKQAQAIVAEKTAPVCETDKAFYWPLLIYFWSKEHQKRLKRKIIVD